MNVWVLFYQLLPVTLALFAVVLMLFSPTPRQLGLSIKYGSLALVLSIIYELIMVNLGVWSYPMDELIWNIPVPIYFLSAIIFAVLPYMGILKIEHTTKITLWILIVSIPILGILRDYIGGKFLAPDLIDWQIPMWFIFDLVGWVLAYLLPIIPLLKEYEQRGREM